MADEQALWAPADWSAQPDAAIARAVGAKLGMILPPPCVPGVAANMRLLATHLAVLDAALDPPA